MAITSMNALIAALPGRHQHLYKASATAEGAGTFHSLWATAGRPGAGATPAVMPGVVPTSATAGAIPIGQNAQSGNKLYLARYQASLSTAGLLVLYDRLWHGSGLDTTLTTAQNVNSAALTRYTDGEDVEVWGEVYTAPGATTATWTLSYTNQAGTAGQIATYTHPANAESVGQMLPFTLAAGDLGVRSIQTFTASASSGTAGNVGLTLMKRIAEIPVPQVNVGQDRDAFAVGLPEIVNNACLALMTMCTTTNTGILLGAIEIVEG